MKFLSGIAVLLVVAGCSSSSDDHSQHSSSSSSSGSTGDTSTSSSSSGATATAPKAPKIDEVAKMTGALHVMWTNNETGCDAVEGERQAQMADGSIMEKYKVAFTVPGDVDNKHDTTATEDMKYTYRLRCKKGTTYSDYSNEMSANPVK